MSEKLNRLSHSIHPQQCSHQRADAGRRDASIPEGSLCMERRCHVSDVASSIQWRLLRGYWGHNGVVEAHSDIDYCRSRPSCDQEMLNGKRRCEEPMLQMDNIIAVVSLTYSDKKTILSAAQSNLSRNGVVLHHMIRLSGNAAHSLNRSSNSPQLSNLSL